MRCYNNTLLKQSLTVVFTERYQSNIVRSRVFIIKLPQLKCFRKCLKNIRAFGLFWAINTYKGCTNEKYLNVTIPSKQKNHRNVSFTWPTTIYVFRAHGSLGLARGNIIIRNTNRPLICLKTGVHVITLNHRTAIHRCLKFLTSPFLWLSESVSVYIPRDAMENEQTSYYRINKNLG